MSLLSPGQRFRTALAEEKPLQVIGAINANHALLAKRAGFKAIYLSGGGVAAGSLGLPDLGINTLDDVLNQSLTVMHELDRMLDRPHLMSRFRRWRTLVDNSLFSPRGQERILNRWRRLGGIVDWSETA